MPSQNPAIFKEIRHYLRTGENLPVPGISEQVALLKKMIEISIEDKGLPGGILHMRRHMAKNFKGLPDFKPLRIAMLRTGEKDELWKILDEIAEKYTGES